VARARSSSNNSGSFSAHPGLEASSSPAPSFKTANRLLNVLELRPVELPIYVVAAQHAPFAEIAEDLKSEQ
jgi:hypothetical protein